MTPKHIYTPIICVQKCKTVRTVTYIQKNVATKKQSTLFVKNSPFENQLWKLPETAQNVVDTLTAVQNKLRY